MADVEKREMEIERERGIERLVQNEIYCCATDIVEYILKSSETVEDAPFGYDDIEYGHIDNSDEIDELQEKLDALEENEPEEPDQGETETDEDFDKRWDEWNKEWDKWETERDNLDYKIRELEDEQDETTDVYEWWEVSSWLADDLYNNGETVIRGWHNYWGRGCTGQAISMDYVIGKIYDDIHISIEE
jgi:hypothetical protein